MQIQIWSRSRATPKGPSMVSLAWQSSICPVPPGRGEMFISMGSCSPRRTLEDDGGKGPVRHAKGLEAPLCKSHLPHWYHVINVSMQDNHLKFLLRSVCDPGLYVAGSSWQKRGGFGNGRAAGDCVRGGYRPQQVPPANPSPCRSIGASGTLQPGQGHRNRTFPRARFSPAPHPATQATVGAGSETSVPQQ